LNRIREIVDPGQGALSLKERPMVAFELVGMALFALFFGALITNKESISR
jgi:hypothetical protein